MQISKIIKWLPVVLSVLGALGYSSRDTELIRSGVSVAATLAQNDNIGLEKVNEWLGENVIKATSDKKAKVRVFESDRYQREVAQVSVGTIDLNLMQIRDGAAWHYESYAKKQQSKTAYTDYSAAQKQAKEKRKGLWKKDNPQAPWQFRRQNHEQQNGNKKQSDKQWFGIW